MKTLLAFILLFSSCAFATCSDNCGAFQGECMSCHTTSGRAKADSGEYPPNSGPECEDCWFCAGLASKPAPAPQRRAMDLLSLLAEAIPRLHPAKPLPTNHVQLLKLTLEAGVLPRGFAPGTLALIRLDTTRWKR